jgi:hypothetical protein
MTKLNVALGTGAVAVALLAGAAALAQDDAAADVATYGPETFSADEFHVDGFAGTVELIVEDRSDIEISAHGPSERMADFEVTTPNGRVEISYEEQKFRWNDWSTWLGWWRSTTFHVEDYPVVTVRLPAGTPVDISGMTGNFTAGDLGSALEFSGAGAVDATIGNLRSADFSVAGAADVTLGEIAGDLDVSIAGAGDFEAVSAQNVSINLRGAGDVSLGAVRGGLDISVAGMGDVDVASVNGPVDINVAGSGDVTIEDGRATSFDVSIAGSGDVTFRGTAVDPDVSVAGSGDVYIERYEGNLSHSGMGEITIGSGS